MACRNELVMRAHVVGLDPANYPNDSKLEQKVLYLEKNATAQTGTISTTTLTSDGTATSNGSKLQIGGYPYIAKTALTETKASSTLTSDGTAPSDGDSVTVEGVTYTFRTALTNTVGAPYEVLIGNDAATALDNLKLAINKGATEGTNYGTGTVAHPLVTAEANADTTQEVTAKKVGTYANRFLTSEKCAHLAWDDTTLGGSSATPGVDPVPGEVLIGSTSNGAAFLDNLKVAIDNGTGEGTVYATGTPKNLVATATTNSNTEQVITSRDFAILNGDIATTETGGADHLAFTSTAMGSGVTKVITPNTTTYAGAKGISGDKNLL